MEAPANVNEPLMVEPLLDKVLGEDIEMELFARAGTNPAYLAENGFDVTALDISDRAVELAMEKARQASVIIDFLIGDFTSLPFKEDRFGFVFDFGCFHHVEPELRTTFVEGVHRALDNGGTYLMVCFSDKNGRATNHFSREKIVELFWDRFEIGRMNHISSVEGDGVTRYFYEVLMNKPES